MVNAVLGRSVATAAVAAGLIVASGCHTASALKKVDSPAGPVTVSALWMNPDDITTRDLYGGVAGADNAPHATSFGFLKDESLASWGYDVSEADGRHWSVKLGEEVHAEVASSRLLWAIGYYQPAVYVVDQWTLTGKHAGPQPAGRFRLEYKDQKVVDLWSWYENPFVGTREFGGLIAVNMLLNNWDYKTQNNKVYELKQPVRGQSRVYVVRDLGATLGMTRRMINLKWVLGSGHPQGTKSDVDDFESQGFVKGVEGEHVVFDHDASQQTLAHAVTVDDVHWVCGLLNQLTREQMLDAFRAAHYDQATSERYVKKIREKVAQGLALAAAPGAIRREQ